MLEYIIFVLEDKIILKKFKDWLTVNDKNTKICEKKIIFIKFFYNLQLYVENLIKNLIFSKLYIPD